MIKNVKKPKLTIDKVGQMAQREFLGLGKKIDGIREDVSDIRENMATRDDLHNFATKDDLKAFATKDDLKTTEVKILQAVDKVVTKFDKAEKEEAAHISLHKRITDDLHGHDQRIKKLEVKV